MKPYIGSEVNWLSSYLPVRRYELLHFHLQLRYKYELFHIYFTTCFIQ